MKQFSQAKLGAILLLTALFSNQKNYSQTPTLQFAHSLETMHEHGIWSRATVTDSSGNFYMTGLYHGTVDFDTSAIGSFPLTYQGGPAGAIDGEADVYVVKYTAAGELVWAKNLIEPTFVNTNEERASSMIIDGNSIYLTGFTSTRGFFVSKWNTDGIELWTKYFDDLEENLITTFALKKLNNSILISGNFTATMDFNPSPTATEEITSINGDGFLLSLSDTGNFEWVKQFRCNGVVVLSGLEVDETNNIFLSGSFVGSVDLDPDVINSSIITSQSVSFGAFSSAFLAKFNSLGNLIWSRHIKGTAPTDIFFTFIKKNTENDIIMTYSLKGNATFLPTTTTLDTNNLYSSVLVKYSTNGNLIWTKRFATPTSTQTTFFPSSFTSNVITDSCDNIYVSGKFEGNCDFDPTANEEVRSTLNNTTDTFIASYSSNGEYLWSMDIGKFGNMTFVDFNGFLPIALDQNNDLIITGTYRGEIDVDPSTNEMILNSNTGSIPNNAGVFIAKYDNPISGCLLNTSIPVEKNFSIHPNPTKGLVTISTKMFSESYRISVYDISGKNLISAKVESQEHTIDLSYLSKGIYIIELKNNAGSYHQKLILE